MATTWPPNGKARVKNIKYSVTNELGFLGFLLVRRANADQLHLRLTRSVHSLYVPVILHLLHGFGPNSDIHVDAIVTFHQSGHTTRRHSATLHR